tara:strand:+ start:850 stop:1236 length:387 start_codon:yes stop_codon:yes gene_type:complete
MSFIHLVWKINDEKIKKSKREKKNNMLEKEIERNIEATESDFYHKFTDKVVPVNEESNMNLINFRDSIEINVEKRNNNREILEKRLNSREKMSYGCVNPFLTSNKYLDDISNEDKYLRPKNTNEINKK